MMSFPFRRQCAHEGFPRNVQVEACTSLLKTPEDEGQRDAKSKALQEVPIIEGGGMKLVDSTAAFTSGAVSKFVSPEKTWAQPATQRATGSPGVDEAPGDGRCDKDERATKRMVDGEKDRAERWA
eukprot:Skav200938  [mRNA]  locus=scaffold2433:778069:779414:- [translate_table: standard]